MAQIDRTWIYEPRTGYIRNATNPAKCIQKQRDDFRNGNPLELWDCGDGLEGNQAWDLPIISTPGP